MKFHFGKDAYMITQLGQKQVFFPCAISAILDVADGSSELSVYAYCMCCVQCAQCFAVHFGVASTFQSFKPHQMTLFLTLLVDKNRRQYHIQ